MNHPNRSRPRVRPVQRCDYSCPPDMQSEWTVYQVVHGLQIISQHDTEREADAALAAYQQQRKRA